MAKTNKRAGKRKPAKLTKPSAVPTEFRPVVRKGSEKQIAWIFDMLDNKQLDKWPLWERATKDLSPKQLVKFKERYKEQIKEMSFDNIQKLIEALRYLPRIGATSNGGHSNGGLRIEYEIMEDDNGRALKRGRIYMTNGKRVLAGSYGLKTPDENFTNEITFFRVWIGDRGGWDVQMYVSDDLRRVQISHSTKLWVLKKIAKNPEKAASRFGKEFKRCGICGRGLTKDESRARGIGPVCAGRL